MVIVKESFAINNATVLVCEMFDNDIVTDQLITSVGNFKKGDFVVEDSKSCFSNPSTRNIVIKRVSLSNQIDKIAFA